MALGVTYQLPVDDRTSYAEDYLRARITSALGGRAAEKLVYGVVTTGAENDLQQVTEIARHMVLRWGMSEKLGPISFVAPQDEGLPPAFQHQPYSEATSELIDAEVRRIVEESHCEADRLLTVHRDKLETLAQALLKAECLNEKEIREVTGLTAPGQETHPHVSRQARDNRIGSIHVPSSPCWPSGMIFLRALCRRPSPAATTGSSSWIR